MDSNRIKRLATGAREGLRREVSARLDALLAAGSAERLGDPAAVERLERQVRSEGRERVVDSAAYTWFNRLCALRFMDANGYTPVGAVTPQAGSTSPAVLADAQAGLFAPEYAFEADVRSRVTSLLAGGGGAANATEAAYAELLRAVCDHYAGPMPFLFGEDAASWLLMPRSLLAEGSILQRIVDEMDGESCKSVEVLGWLYQHYIAERYKEIRDSFNRGKKVDPEEIGPATQLFTPKWVVKYLCENSLGRLWILNNPNSNLAEHMDYYIATDDAISYEEIGSASEIRILDPACGSGHILVYAFDLLFAMYEEEGWPPEDIPTMILRNNLHGLEIDGRAAEIAMFALVMKARERDPRFFEHSVQPYVSVLRPVEFDETEAALVSDGLCGNGGFLDVMKHMSEVGSLFIPNVADIDAIKIEIAQVGLRTADDDMIAQTVLGKLETMLENVEALMGNYHCVIGNPPYMGLKHFSSWLYAWLSSNYPQSYYDYYACFMSRSFEALRSLGYSALVVMHTWATDKSFMNFRKRVLSSKVIISMLHMAPTVMPIAFDTSATLLANCSGGDKEGVFIRVERDDVVDGMLGPKDFGSMKRYHHNALDYESIPEHIIAYWIPKAAQEAFGLGRTVGNLMMPRVGIQTGNTDRFLRNWWEVSRKTSFTPLGENLSIMADKKWIPYKNAGDFRKWYGNNVSLINWQNDGYEVIGLAAQEKRKVMSLPAEYRFKRFVSWNDYGLGSASVRLSPEGYLFDVIEPAFVDTEGSGLASLYFMLAYLNSSVAAMFIRLLMPGRHKNVGKMAKLPLPIGAENEVLARPLAENNTRLSKTDWDSFETSWDFKRHPLV